MNDPLRQKLRHRMQAEDPTSEPHPPLTDAQIAEVTQTLGFTPAALYLDLLKTLGNGGFGPGYGIMGLLDGAADDQGNTADALYLLFADPDPDDPAWAWPRGLLPICHWGCAIYSCIDHATPEPMIRTWDPNMWGEGDPPANAILPTGLSLAQWLDAWGEGVDLWRMMYPE